MARLEDYVNALAVFEQGLKAKNLEIADLSKKLIIQAEALSHELEKVAESKYAEIKQMIDNEIKNETFVMKNEYEKLKAKNIEEVRNNAQKNFDKAVDFLVSKVLEVLRS